MKRIFFSHWCFFLILIGATLIRLVGLSQQMIFIGDQGRDFLVAQDIVTKGKIPLLGIPSSIPRFSQGPLYIYFLAIVYWLTHGSVLATGVMAASFGLAAVAGIYVLVLGLSPEGEKRYTVEATIAALCLAFSPMLILHSRMPYHVNPIPLAVLLYLWQIMRLLKNKQWSAFGSGLGFALVFQCELAAFPLVLLLLSPVASRIDWKNFLSVPKETLLSHWNGKKTLTVFFGVLIGLLPQVIYDFTHKFSQLGGFLVWVLYRIASALLPFTRHSFFDQSTPSKLSDLLTLFISIFSQNGMWGDALFWTCLCALSIILFCRFWQKHTMPEKICVAGYIVLLGGLIFHRVPSEAYMPLLAPFAILSFVFVLRDLIPMLRGIVLIVVSLSLCLSSTFLYQKSFLLLNPGESNWEEKRFGPSLQSQRQIVGTLYTLSEGHCVVLQSLERDQTFPTLYNHIEYLLALDSRSRQEPCRIIRIDRPTFARTHWIEGGEITDLGAYWVQLIQARALYAKKLHTYSYRPL